MEGPGAEEVRPRFPRWIGLGQQAPSYSSLEHIQDGIRSPAVDPLGGGHMVWVWEASAGGTPIERRSGRNRRQRFSRADCGCAEHGNEPTKPSGPSLSLIRRKTTDSFAAAHPMRSSVLSGCHPTFQTGSYDPSSATAAHEGARLQPERDGRVRCSAWLGIMVNPTIQLKQVNHASWRWRVKCRTALHLQPRPAVVCRQPRATHLRESCRPRERCQ